MDSGKNKPKWQCKPSCNKTKKKSTYQNQQYRKSQLKRNQMKKNLNQLAKRTSNIAELPQRGDAKRIRKLDQRAQELAEREKVKKEKEQQIKAYKKKRLQKTKAISKKTQFGQPVMKDRLQLLLQQIEKLRNS